MKEKLLELIDKTDEIEKLFHPSGNYYGISVIGGEQPFQIWLKALQFELQHIYDKTKNEFIWDSIKDLTADFNGWRDKKLFDKIKGDLFTIKENIDSFYPQEQLPKTCCDKEETKMEKQPKIFISHKKEDSSYVEKIVQLIEHIGVKQKDIFCSSMPGYGVPNSKDIFEFLREQFMKYNLYVVFVHSVNFYRSPVGLNEMGAAWVLRNDHISFLLPNFDFKDMTGVINSREAAIKLDADIYEVRDRLNQFRDTLTNVFGLTRIDGIVWEKTRDEFIEEVNFYLRQGETGKKTRDIEELNEYAEELLLNASKTDNSHLLISVTLSGTTIQTTPKCYSSSMGDREFSRWEAALDELVREGYMKRYGKDGCLLKLTNKGYTYLENKHSDKKGT